MKMSRATKRFASSFVTVFTAVFTTVLVMGLTGCAPSGQSPFAALDVFGIFTDRPTLIERYMVVARLKTPALAETATYENGVMTIDPTQSDAVKAEQQEFISEVQAISSDIKVVFTYSMILNAVAIDMPYHLRDRVKGLAMVAGLDTAGHILPPSLPTVDTAATEAASTLRERNSVKFIGAEKVHSRSIKNASGVEVPLDGTGMKIGVIDSGIDYTHAMFGGPGTEEAYTSIDPLEPTKFFPSTRVVGGFDFAGSNFDPTSPNLDLHIPVPDSNPLDQGAHGSHVAGTIGGVGDGVNSYSGVAPGAALYALKVFGKGPTSDTLVLAAMDYAMDPNRDGDPADRLDVLNLSLGHEFGSASGLYAVAIRNLARAGVVTIASAGNEGDFAYITGAPSSVDEALSVAASIDDADQNTKFPTIAISSTSLGRFVAQRVEGPVSLPIGSLSVALEGPLVDIGLADKELSPEVAAQLKGKVALAARGGVAFQVKLENAFKAGAIGVLVTNNNDEPAFPMGGEGKVEIPAAMISKAEGDRIRSVLATEEVRVEFTAKEMLDKPELVDTIVGFSSAGPRSVDSAIKPEITAPGSNIISAAAGKGSAVAQMSGTSMAGPHVAGAMALLKQAYPKLSVNELKNLMMGRTVRLQAGVARQGAGRIAIDRAIESPLVAQRGAFSLGRVQVMGRKGLFESIAFKSLAATDKEYSVSLESRHTGLSLANPQTLELKAFAEATLDLNFLIDAAKMSTSTEIMDGWIVVKEGDVEVYHIPVLAMVRQLSNIQLGSLKVQSASHEEAAGAATELNLKNLAANAGDVMLFNLLDTDARKPNVTNFELCDMQAVGYRLVNKEIEGQKTQVLQVAVKLYQPMTTFDFCEVTVLLDGNGDGVEDQELAMISLKHVDGLSTPQTERNFASVLLDAQEMRKIRKAAEDDAKVSQKSKDIDYKPAVLDMLPFEPKSQSTINWVEARVDQLQRSRTGELSLKIAALQLDSSSDESDDFLGEGGKVWMKLSLMPESQAYIGLPEILSLAGKSETNVRLKKGESRQPLMILLPQNATGQSNTVPDRQMILAEPEFVFKN